MISFKTVLQKFGDKGEKTGWTYIEVPAKTAGVLKQNNKMSFRVKGKIDTHKIAGVALVPMGDGNFILAVNATMRRAIKKNHGASVLVELKEDKTPVKLSGDLIDCFKDDPDAEIYFNTLPPSHRNWYSNWVKGAKTEVTKSKRISTVIRSCSRKLTFSEMMQQYREEKNTIQ